jgi:3',5'-cyclic AMP phosphodiesterase CpdA
MHLLLVSDTHLSRETQAFAENWRVVREHIEAAPPDLIVHLGDISVDGAGRPTELEEAAEHFGDLRPRMRFLPGNHDIGDNPREPGAKVEAEVTAARLDAYRKTYGADYWSFEAGSWQLIGLNAQLFGTEGEEEERQFTWLGAALRGASGPLGIFVHKPLFRDRAEDGEAHVRYMPLAPRRRLLELLASRDLRFVASGHAHQERRGKLAGVEYVWAPSVSFCIPDAMQERVGEKEVGVVGLNLGESGHQFESLRLPGLRRHNLLDYPQLYPGLAELRERLGAGAIL